ncbi:hypothetical protein SLA2020_250270 [Shorea laevis]
MNVRPMESWQPPLEILLRSILIQQYHVGKAEPGLELSFGSRNCDSKVIGAAQRTCGFQGSVLQAEVMALLISHSEWAENLDTEMSSLS